MIGIQTAGLTGQIYSIKTEKDELNAGHPRKKRTVDILTLREIEIHNNTIRDKSA